MVTGLPSLKRGTRKLATNKSNNSRLASMRSTPVHEELLPNPKVDLNFSDGAKNKKSYLTGFEAGVNLIMEYWLKGVEKGEVLDNLEQIKWVMRDQIQRSGKAAPKPVRR